MGYKNYTIRRLERLADIPGLLRGWTLGATQEEELAEANTLVHDLLNLRSEIVGKSQAISQMVDATRPGIGSNVDWTAIITGKGGGGTARQFFNLRDAANALYAEAQILFDSWDAIFDAPNFAFKRQVILADVQSYHARFVDMLNRHKQFLGEVDKIVKKGPEKEAEDKTPDTGIPKIIKDIGEKVLIYGGIGLLLFKVVIPALQKKYAKP